MRTLVLGMSVIVLNSCSSAKPIAKVENSTAVEVPFTERKFKTDDKFFRATGPSPGFSRFFSRTRPEGSCFQIRRVNDQTQSGLIALLILR